MKKYWLLIFLSIPFLLNARNAKEAFLSMPLNMFTELSINNRMDLVDSYEAETDASVQNKLQEDVIIEKLTEDYLLLNSGNSTIQIIVLPMVNESQLYCLIHTVCGPICDSKIEFYSLSWKKLSTDTFISIAPQSWFIENMNEFPELAISFLQFLFDPDKKILKQINNSPSYLGIQEQKKIKPYIKKESREYKWDGLRFQ